MKKVLAILVSLIALITIGIVIFNGGGQEHYEPLELERTGNYTTGRDMLDSTLVENYDTMIKNIYRLQPSFDVEVMSSKNLKKLIHYVRDDNPQMFWLGFNYSYEHNVVTQEITGVTLQYYYTDEDTGEDVFFTNDMINTMSQEIELAADEILKGVQSTMSTYEKVKYLHDYLAKNVAYDEEATFQHNIYGALVEKRAVCDGLSYSMMYLLSRLGIDSRLAYGESFEGVAHAWNVIDIDGVYYHIDVTWDMPSEGTNTVLYSNFAITDEQIINTRKLFSPFEGKDPKKYFYYIPIPNCTETKFNYYNYHNLYIADYSDESLNLLFNRLETAVAKKEMQVQFRFEFEEDVKRFVEEVTSGDNRKYYRFPYSNSKRKTSLSKIERDRVVIINFTYNE